MLLPAVVQPVMAQQVASRSLERVARTAARTARLRVKVARSALVTVVQLARRTKVEAAEPVEVADVVEALQRAARVALAAAHRWSTIFAQ